MYLGIDPGIRELGLAVLNSKGTLIKIEEIRVKYNNITEALYKLERVVKRYIIKYKIQYIMVEDYAFAMFKYSRSGTSLAEFGGVMKNLFYKEKKLCLTVPTTSLKKIMLGKGNVSKEHLIGEAYNKFKIVFKSTHEAISYMLVKFIFILINEDKIELTKEKKQLLKKYKDKRNIIKIGGKLCLRKN